ISTGVKKSENVKKQKLKDGLDTYEDRHDIEKNINEKKLRGIVGVVRANCIVHKIFGTNVCRYGNKNCIGFDNPSTALGSECVCIGGEIGGIDGTICNKCKVSKGTCMLLGYKCNGFDDPAKNAQSGTDCECSGGQISLNKLKCVKCKVNAQGVCKDADQKDCNGFKAKGNNCVCEGLITMNDKDGNCNKCKVNNKGECMVGLAKCYDFEAKGNECVCEGRIDIINGENPKCFKCSVSNGRCMLGGNACNGFDELAKGAQEGIECKCSGGQISADGLNCNKCKVEDGKCKVKGNNCNGYDEMVKDVKEGTYCKCTDGQLSEDGINCIKCKVSKGICKLDGKICNGFDELTKDDKDGTFCKCSEGKVTENGLNCIKKIPDETEEPSQSSRPQSETE
ncbi:MAG: hypothetical protein HUK13_10365, partial [Muribaculaceae bacterium]|nr:hypothetical protein [Muribaculaceae bacterium]